MCLFLSFLLIWFHSFVNAFLCISFSLRSTARSHFVSHPQAPCPSISAPGSPAGPACQGTSPGWSADIQAPLSFHGRLSDPAPYPGFPVRKESRIPAVPVQQEPFCSSPSGIRPAASESASRQTAYPPGHLPRRKDYGDRGNML